MTIGLAVLSTVIVAFSVYGALLPHRLIAWIRGLMSGGLGLWIAAGVRLLLAVLLWLTAPVSRTPALFKPLAALALLAAIAIPVVGRPRIARLVDSLSSWPGWAIRLGCLFGVAFGGFLLWSIAPAIGAG